MLTLNAATKLYAQQGDRGAKMQQANKAFLKDSVQLSDVLVDSVTAIRTQYQPQMRQIFMDQSASMDDKQAKLQTLRTAMEARYKAAGVTDAQVQQMRDHENRMMAQMRARMSNNGQ